MWEARENELWGCVSWRVHGMDGRAYGALGGVLARVGYVI